MQRAFRSALVSTKWLRDVLKVGSMDNHRILDTTWHLPMLSRNAAEEFKQQHIPRARYFDIVECSDKPNPVPFMLPSSEVFESYVGRLGINNDNHVILYDNHPELPVFIAQRVWWTFRVFGHDRVSVLDGGLKKWIAENGQVTSSIEDFAPEKYRTVFQPHLIKDYVDIEKNIKDPEFQLADTRPQECFNGTEPEPLPGLKPGNIVSSVNFPFTEAMDLENQCLKSPEELKTLFDEKGIDLDKPLVATCTIGVSANVLALAAYECGYDKVSVYDGSWAEWFYTAPDELKKDVPSDEAYNAMS